MVVLSDESSQTTGVMPAGDGEAYVVKLPVPIINGIGFFTKSSIVLPIVKLWAAIAADWTVATACAELATAELACAELACAELASAEDACAADACADDAAAPEAVNKLVVGDQGCEFGNLACKPHFHDKYPSTSCLCTSDKFVGYIRTSDIGKGYWLPSLQFVVSLPIVYEERFNAADAPVTVLVRRITGVFGV